MTAPCPILKRKMNILGRVEKVPGTVVGPLTADDGKMRIIAGASPEYNAPRESRDIARASLTNLGSVESTKALNITFRTEMNTRDTIANLSDLDVESILFQSAITGGAGSIQRVKFNSTPDLSAIVEGMYLDINYDAKSSNNGTFLITLVNDGADEIDYVNRVRVDNTDDVASLSAGIGDIQFPLDFMWAFYGCMSEVRGASRIPIGEITVSTYVRNEIVTGGTSSATVRVIAPVIDGETHIYFEPLTGKLVTAEVLTGSISGAVSTSSSGPQVHGHFVKPVSGDNCDSEVVSIDFENDGFRWKARSSMGNMTFENGANQRMFLDFAFQGPKDTIENKAMTTVTRDSEDPPIAKTSELKFDAFSPVWTKITFDMGNNVILRPNGNATGDSGFESARVTARDPKVTITLEHELTTAFDFFDKLDNGTKIALQHHVGTVLDKKIWFFCDELEFDELPIGDLDGITSLDVTASCTGAANDSNDEWEFLIA